MEAGGAGARRPVLRAPVPGAGGQRRPDGARALVDSRLLRPESLLSLCACGPADSGDPAPSSFHLRWKLRSR